MVFKAKVHTGESFISLPPLDRNMRTCWYYSSSSTLQFLGNSWCNCSVSRCVSCFFFCPACEKEFPLGDITHSAAKLTTRPDLWCKSTCDTTAPSSGGVCAERVLTNVCFCFIPAQQESEVRINLMIKKKEKILLLF